MKNDRFLKRLKKEMPLWVKQGWIREEGGKAILEHVAAQGEGGTKYLTMAFSILGVVLLGAGIITFFAANWSEMSKLSKLGVLFGSMWTAYITAYYLIEEKDYPYLGQAILLLGVILFGSNIMLIAQIYHIDSHYPNGVLIWSLGGLLVAYLMGSQPAMVASTGLAILWTSMESFGFERTFHWTFLIVWAASLPIIIRLQWKHALHVALVGLLVWSWQSFMHLAGFSEWAKGSALYLMQIYLAVYLGLFILGMVMDTYKDLEPLSSIVLRYGAFAALASFHSLTYPDLGIGGRWGRAPVHGASAYTWFAITVAALLGVALLSDWHRQRSGFDERPSYLKWGQGLLGLLAVLLLVNIFAGGAYGGLMAILFNLIFFAALVWLIYAGMHSEDRGIVNMAFFFFAVTVLARYFDTFWSLMNRSFFFMAGGILLIGGGYYIEKQRRRITQKIMESRKAGGEYGN